MLRVGDVVLFNVFGRYKEEWSWAPKTGECVKILDVYPRTDDELNTTGELVDFVSEETGAIYKRFSVEWFAPKKTEEPF